MLLRPDGFGLGAQVTEHGLVRHLLRLRIAVLGRHGVMMRVRVHQVNLTKAMGKIAGPIQPSSNLNELPTDLDGVAAVAFCRSGVTNGDHVTFAPDCPRQTTAA